MDPSVLLFGQHAHAQTNSIRREENIASRKQVIVADKMQASNASVMNCGVDKRLYNMEKRGLHKRAESGFSRSISKQYIDLQSHNLPEMQNFTLYSKPTVEAKYSVFRKLKSFSDFLKIRCKESKLEMRRASEANLIFSMLNFPTPTTQRRESNEDAHSNQPCDNSIDNLSESDNNEEYTHSSDLSGKRETANAALPFTISERKSNVKYWLGCKYRYFIISEILEIIFLQNGVFTVPHNTASSLYVSVSLEPGRRQKQRIELCEIGKINQQFPSKRLRFENFTCSQIRRMQLRVKLEIRTGVFRRPNRVLLWTIPLSDCDILRPKTIWKDVYFENQP